MKRSLTALTVILILLSLTSSVIAEEQGDIKKRFSVDKGGNLEMKIGSGNIEIHSWDKNEASIKIIGAYEDDLEKVKINQYGNTIKINSENWGGYDSDIEVYIPNEFNMNLQAAGGDLRIIGSYKGNINATTSGGDIIFNNVKGNVYAYTSGGDIITGNIEGNVVIKTSGGDIVAKSFDKDAEINTSGGDIKIGEVGNYLKATTNGGDVIINKIGGSAAVVTYGGDIKISKIAGSVNANTYGGDIIINGASGKTIVKTGGGDLRLYKITGSIDAKTQAGDISAELIPDGKGITKIYSGSGLIKLLVPSNVKAEIEAKIKYPLMDDENSADIISDFKSHSYKKSHQEIWAKYMLNGGGEKIYLETTNSNIEIRKFYKK